MSKATSINKQMPRFSISPISLSPETSKHLEMLFKKYDENMIIINLQPSHNSITSPHTKFDATLLVNCLYYLCFR